MTGYTKLFGSILASTIWREDDKTRIVWITMLAMSNREGVCEASVPGLADFARVSVDDCRAALEKLMAPDPDSRSQEHEGRRIAKIDGGWVILNHRKYREKMNADERREYNRLKQAEWRQKNKSLTVIDRQSQSAMSAHTEADAEADAVNTPLPPATSPDQESLPKEPSPVGDERADFKLTAEPEKPQRSITFSPEALEIFNLYPPKRKVGKLIALRSIEKALKRLPAPQLREKTKAYAEAVKRWPPGNENFIPLPATWFNQGRYLDDPATWERVAPENAAAGRRQELVGMISRCEARMAAMPDGPARVAAGARIANMRQQLKNLDNP